MTASPSVTAAIAELTAQRDQLTSVIDGLIALFVIDEAPARKAEFRFQPPIVKTPRMKVPAPPVPPINLRAPEVTSKAEPRRHLSENGRSLRDEIREVVNSGRKLTSVQIIDMVADDNPGCDRNYVSTCVSQLVSTGEFRKLDDLTIVPGNRGGK